MSGVESVRLHITRVSVSGSSRNDSYRHTEEVLQWLDKRFLAQILIVRSWLHGATEWSSFRGELSSVNKIGRAHV